MIAVSILIPCCNSEQWIEQAIRSALEQTYANKEVVVVDDGSTDSSLRIIRSFGSAIRCESGPNRGGNNARNRLMKLAVGEWLQYLDADDYLLPEKVEHQIRALGDSRETDIVYSPVILEHASDVAPQREVLNIPEPHDEWILLARWFLPQTGAVLWRKKALLEVGGWRPEQPACQEHELYLRMLMAGKRFLFCPHAGAVYRQWGEHTVCKRDKPLVRQLRMEIEQRAEDFLRREGELSTERLWAINMARFEMARLAWPSDLSESTRIFQTVTASDPEFYPQGPAAPESYRLVYRLFGFVAAERLAALWRRLRH